MKNLSYTLILILLCLTQSCETDVPDTDNTPPEFSFQIIGDGLDHTFTQDDDFANIQLNLRHDQSYNFNYVGTDNGGVQLIRWQLPSSDYIEFNTAIPSPWTITILSPLSRLIQWQGDSNNALTAGILTGTFEANGENVSDTFRFLVSDFGGTSGTSNNVSKELTIYIGEHNTAIINL